ncbi:Acyl-[acyl-carrier-protein] hydrolase [Rhynchospora pubera]|uniref:Acyl-[acyl-carrier-protein] hydrolase n=1 Tax=Rhynchospora pubera TaxID=906938 RepID=A0AAV8EJG7_9POAL|nr:Acyl-[acyl-carrier-protein] hydrolase [Rhynchospora pubera]
MTRKPQPSLRVMCGSHNGSTTAYHASVPDTKRRETKKALVAERDPTRVLTLGERMRFGRLLKDRFTYKESFVVRSFEVGEMWWKLNIGARLKEKIAGRFDYIIKLLSTNEVIGRATSKWVMINKDTHKPQKINKQVWDEYFAFCSKPSRLAFPEESDKILKKISKLNEPAEYSQLGLVPRRSDLNMNGHVNSVTCFSFLLESVPQDIIDNYELSSITIDYRQHFQFDDSLDSYTSSEVERVALNGLSDCSCLLDFNPNDGKLRQFLHSLKLSRTGQETNRGRTTWRRH